MRVQGWRGRQVSKPKHESEDGMSRDLLNNEAQWLQRRSQIRKDDGQALPSTMPMNLQWRWYRCGSGIFHNI